MSPLTYSMSNYCACSEEPTPMEVGKAYNTTNYHIGCSCGECEQSVTRNTMRCAFRCNNCLRIYMEHPYVQILDPSYMTRLPGNCWETAAIKQQCGVSAKWLIISEMGKVYTCSQQTAKCSTMITPRVREFATFGALPFNKRL